MKTGKLVLADDLGDRSLEGRRRSRILRDCAIQMAHSLNLQVEIIFVNETSKQQWKTPKTQIRGEDILSIENAVLEHFNKNSLKAKVIYLYGNPAEEILKYLEFQPDVKMLLIGTQGRTGLKKVLLGSVAEEVLRHVKLPALVIGPHALKTKFNRGLGSKSRILLLSDFSKSAVRAEKFAMSLLKDFKCHLILLNCLGDRIMRTRMSLYGSGYVPLNLEQIFSDMQKQSLENIKKRKALWRKNKMNVTPQIDTNEEPIEKTFDRKIKENFDLVVMGTHGRGPIIKAFIGSATRKIILRSPTPVFIVPSGRLTF